MEQARPIKEKTSHKWTLEKTETVEEKKKKSMTNEMTKSLMDLPVEVLVKIFNFLPNHHHDIRCGISLTCKKFHEICKDESLVLIKDLCINDPFLDGQDEDHYDRCIEHISKKIVQSKHLTSLKITKMDNFSVDELVSIALKNCPKLIHLEFPTSEPSVYF